MAVYGIFDGADLASTCEAESAEFAPAGFVLLEGWPGWAPRPSPSHRMRLVGEVWQWVDTRTPDQAKAEAWERIKLAAEAAEFSTFTWSGDVFQCDEKSTARIRGAVLRTLLADNSRSAASDWVKLDNTIRSITNAQMGAFGDALEAHVEAVHATRQTRRAQIAACTTVAEADAVQWGVA